MVAPLIDSHLQSPNMADAESYHNHMIANVEFKDLPGLGGCSAGEVPAKFYEKNCHSFIKGLGYITCCKAFTRGPPHTF